MAGTTKVLMVKRPTMEAFDANGVSTEPTAANYLEVTLDRYGKGTDIEVHRLPFSDHSGLEAEWTAGVATTVLDAAIAAELPTMTWRPPTLTTAQRAYIATEV
jgi:hypothetical protein